ALQSNLKFGSVKNQEGEFITGSLEGVTTAAKNRLNDLPEDLRWSLTNAPGKGSYPLAGMVFAVIYQKQPAGNGAKIVDFLRWVPREDGGQKYAKELNYAPLLPGVIERIDKSLASVKVGS